jgi:uncharacterized phiE125 gp8 family phage protein
MLLEEIKAHLRITSGDEDFTLASYIRTATDAAEAYMGRGLLTQTWKLLLDGWANIIDLPMAAPLQSVTSVKYYDDAGVLQTLSTSIYDIDTVSRPGRVVLKSDQAWPSWQQTRLNGAIEIVYVVGWASADLIPERIRQGIRQYVGYLYLDREGAETNALAAEQAAERCWSDRISWTGAEWMRA